VCNVLIDSGAFTDHDAAVKAAKRGQAYTPISLDEYVRVCAQEFEPAQVWGYFMLDRIEDPAGTRANLDHMVASGLRPMPILVVNEDLAYLDELVQVNPHVGVALMAGRARREFRYQRLQLAAQRQPGARLHALGLGAWPTMAQLPINSCDSSSFTGGMRYGTFCTFDPVRGVQVYQPRDIFARGTPQARAELNQLLLRYNVTFQCTSARRTPMSRRAWWRTRSRTRTW
jgi:hypothetical protein